MRNVLVLAPGKVVDTRDVSPIPLSGQVFVLDVAPGSGFRVEGSVLVVLGVEFEATTGGLFALFGLLLLDLGQEGLGEVIFESVDQFLDSSLEVVLDFLGGVGAVGIVSDSSGPGVLGDGPGA
jgi:hypothetical protein